MATETPTKPQAAPPALLTKALIRRHYVPAGERTLDRWISQGIFPRPDMALSKKALYWRRESVESWIESRTEGGNQ